MTTKAKSEMKQYKATISVTFDAPDRETAAKRARETFDGPNVKIRLQEAVVGWLTLPETPAQSS
jgi:hypothetical protein